MHGENANREGDMEDDEEIFVVPIEESIDHWHAASQRPAICVWWSR